MNDHNNRDRTTWERIAGFVLASTVLVVFIFILFNPPEVSPNTYAIIRFLAAIAAGLSAALFSGSLHVESQLPLTKGQLKATSAFAAFLVVFFLFFFGIPDSEEKPTGNMPERQIPEELVSDSNLEPSDDETGNQNGGSPNAGQDINSTNKLSLGLKEGRLFEADLETERLVMSMLGKDSIKAKDLENLSCEKLDGIDDLWAEFTGDNLGFSSIRNVFIHPYLESLYISYDPSKYSSYDNDEFEDVAIESGFRETYRHVLSAVGGNEEYRQRKEPTYISAIFPKCTKPAIERFLAMNSKLESCGFVEPKEVIKQKLIERYFNQYVEENPRCCLRKNSYLNISPDINSKICQPSDQSFARPDPASLLPCPPKHPWFLELCES
ncbi:MAG: GUN4 domain-containing protein [Leptolyngbyaceae cyanobacterium MO_188.B28]|nr:GUN4 domain-containing protein [Leptolyngbyaceae cyanobacterium MO_188.B28]